MGRKMISLTKNNELKGYKSLDVYPEVAHFVTTRHEGISTGAYGSFNCSPYTNDSCMNVNRNQSWLFQCMDHQIKELFIPEQSHGCASLIINESFFKESAASESVRSSVLLPRDLFPLTR